MTLADAPDQRHAYKPHRKHFWFCELCGYAEHELLLHLPKQPTPEQRRLVEEDGHCPRIQGRMR